ncbi:nitrite/sulfite reductase [uncultured Tyzzerella sp.]|uniref:nitrite/sulfite reductase n=1 Tax=uncultured Tyzzerella sp. TaxID=2321398 RepID=UPI002942F780|nr:nitrite/sulfite reductase [uncultured Tyzzerella sp.]
MELKNFLYEQIDILREQGEKFLKKEITMHDFKKASGKFGIYAERGGETFMIRIKIPSGVFTDKSINLLQGFIEKYNISKIHPTTRQAIQLHKLSLETVLNIFKECVENDLIGYGSGGNFPRNVTSSPLSNVEKDEAFDVTPYANYVTNYFLKRMDTYNLPRKIKVGFSNGKSNLSNATLTDLGFLAILKDNRKYFKVFVAGGLGKNPNVGLELPYLVEPKEILYYVDALVELFKENGNYENRNKARIRYILKEKGDEGFLDLYNSYIEKSKQKDLCVEEPKDITIPDASEGEIEESNNIIPQKQKGRYTVIIKPIGGIISSQDFNKIINFIKNANSKDYIKLIASMEESFYINNLNSNEAREILDICKDFNQTTKLSQSLSCIGVPVCQIGLAESQGLLNNIICHFKENNLNKDLLPKIHISGCPNSCGRHQVAMIGFMGKRKMVDGEIVDVYELSVDGSFEEKNTRLGKPLCDILAKDIPMFLQEVYENLNNKNIDFESFKDTEDFKALCDKYCVK